jgi:transposase
MKLFCGIDWAEAHHDVAIVDENGQLVAKKSIADDPTGLAQLVELFAGVGDSAEDPIPVAIETPRGLLVASLRTTGRAVYSINPLAVARYRERHSVARSKSDHADAMTLANILRVDAHLHRRLPADSELCQAIAVLARAHQDATWRRIKAHNELRSMLREFFPVFLATFTKRFPLGICQSGSQGGPGHRAHAGSGSEADRQQDCRGAAPRRSQPQHRTDSHRNQGGAAEASAASAWPSGGRDG